MSQPHQVRSTAAISCRAPKTRGRDLNHVAWLYDPVIEGLSFGRERRFRALTLNYMPFAPEDDILDVGCGTGSLTLMIAERLAVEGSVTGIDAAPKMIFLARNKAMKRGLKADFCVGVSESLDYPDQSFDWVVNSMFTHHIDTELKQRSFAEMYRVLRPGGHLVTADIDRPTTLLGKLMGWGGRYILFQKELEDNLMGHLPRLMQGAGFEQVKKLDHVYGLVSFFMAEKPGDKEK